MVNKNLNVKLGNWTLDNPVMLASGTCGYGLEYINLYDPNILGTISIKGTTLKPRFGNNIPRIAEYEGGLINSVGLQNPGVNEVIKKLKTLKKHYTKKVIANIAGTSIEEYVEIIKLMNKCNNVAIFEVNVSCPNIKKDAYSFDTNPEHLSKLIKEIKKISNKPIYIKLSPRAHNIVSLAKKAEESGADGLVLINTMPGMRIDIRTSKPIMSNKIGGCSGPSLKPIALKIIFDCFKEVKIPIIGCGGISNAYDVIEMMMTGATAIQVGSANLVDPSVCKQIIEELPIVMKELRIDNLKDIIGKVHHE